MIPDPCRYASAQTATVENDALDHTESIIAYEQSQFVEDAQWKKSVLLSGMEASMLAGADVVFSVDMTSLHYYVLTWTNTQYKNR